MNKLLFERVIKTSVWTIYDGIDSFNDYTDLIKEFYTAEEGDNIILLLNCPGGRVDIGQTIINAMTETKAVVKCIVEAPCASMAAVIALCGDHLIFSDYTYLMFHTYSAGYFGKESDIDKHHAAHKKHFIELFTHICQPFLTKNECDRIINGEEFYVHWDETNLKSRIKKHFKTTEKKSHE